MTARTYRTLWRKRASSTRRYFILGSYERIGRPGEIAYDALRRRRSAWLGVRDAGAVVWWLKIKTSASLPADIEETGGYREGEQQLRAKSGNRWQARRATYQFSSK